MKHLIAIITLLFTLNAFSQYTAKVSDFHEIPVEDSLTKVTIERYVYYMETNPINYEQYIRQIKEVKMIKEDRYYVGELKEGTLYLNKKLNERPNTKKILILQYLAHNNGMETYEGTSPHIMNRGFYINDYNENMFFKQLRSKSPYRYIVKKLKERSPLKYKY